DLRVAPRRRDPVRDSLVAQRAEQRDRAGEGSPFGEEFAKELTVPRLDEAGLGVAQRFSDLASHRPGEEPTAHADTAVDLPSVDRETGLGERSLPGKHVRVYRVDERSVEVEDQRSHRERA